MDILKILMADSHDVTEEDLLLFEDALSVGDYEITSEEEIADDLYRDQCHKLIEQIRSWKKKSFDAAAWSKNTEGSYDPDHPYSGANSGVIKPSVVPITQASKSPREEVAANLATIRVSDDYKARFKEYVAFSTLLTPSFIDNNFDLFEKLELDYLVSHIAFDEPFLEKRFSQLNSDEIAKHQTFSEEFFMRHYNDLDVNLVLQKGPNPWRDKANRSNKLDVFLRLKGVRL